MMRTADYHDLIEITKILFPELVFELYVNNVPYNRFVESDYIGTVRPQLRLHESGGSFADALYPVESYLTMEANVQQIIDHLSGFLRGQRYRFKHRTGEYLYLTKDIFPKKKCNKEGEVL